MTRRHLDRRTYLRTVGAAGVAGLAGCLGDGGAGVDSPTDGPGTATEEPGAGTEETATAEATETATAAPEQAVTAGTAPGFPPFEIKEGGELKGFDIDLLEAVVAAADGYAMAGWEEFEFDSLIPALTSEKIDVIAAAMTITDQRDETIDFTDPYYSSDQSIIVREGEADRYGSLSDLSGHPVGAQKGTTGEGVVKDQLVAKGELEASNYKAFDNYVLAVQALVNGDVDAVVIDRPVGETFADQRAVEVAFVYETGEQFGFGVRTDDDDLQSGLNAGLQAVRESDRYAEITSEWFGQG